MIDLKVTVQRDGQDQVTIGVAQEGSEPPTISVVHGYQADDRYAREARIPLSRADCFALAAALMRAGQP